MSAHTRHGVNMAGTERCIRQEQDRKFQVWDSTGLIFLTHLRPSRISLLVAFVAPTVAVVGRIASPCSRHSVRRDCQPVDRVERGRVAIAREHHRPPTHQEDCFNYHRNEPTILAPSCHCRVPFAFPVHDRWISSTSDPITVPFCSDRLPTGDNIRDRTADSNPFDSRAIYRRGHLRRRTRWSPHGHYDGPKVP